jgi:short-subunit dehydrogenase
MKDSFLKRYGPWAVVAGASEGLGKAFARALAGKGLNLVLMARRYDPLHALAAELKNNHAIRVRIVQTDLPDNLQRVVRGIRIGLVVYNAAFSNIGRFLERTLEDHKRLVSVNCLGPLTFCHYVAGRHHSDVFLDGYGGQCPAGSLCSEQGLSEDFGGGPVV